MVKGHGRWWWWWGARQVDAQPCPAPSSRLPISWPHLIPEPHRQRGQDGVGWKTLAQRSPDSPRSKMELGAAPVGSRPGVLARPSSPPSPSATCSLCHGGAQLHAWWAELLSQRASW